MKAAALFAVAFVFLGCGPEKPTPEKLYGIWMGKNSDKGKVSYTFILGGKCEITYPESKNPKPDNGKWRIEENKVVVEASDGSRVNLSLSDLDLKTADGGVSVHKLGME